jgi:hypothetical protein
MDMEIDQPWPEPGAAGIDDLVAVRVGLDTDRVHGVSVDDDRGLLDP